MFTWMVEPAQERIYRMALRITRNTEDAEDARQETLLKGYRKLGQFEGRSHFNTWISRIAINEALMCLRKRRPVVTICLEEAMQPTEEASPGYDWQCPMESPEAASPGKELRDSLARAIANLRPSYRAVFCDANFRKPFDDGHSKSPADFCQCRQGPHESRAHHAPQTPARELDLLLRELTTQTSASPRQLVRATDGEDSHTAGGPFSACVGRSAGAMRISSRAKKLLRTVARAIPQCGMASQAVAFNMFLAFFPILLLALDLARSSLERKGGQELLVRLSAVLPPGGRQLIYEFLVGRQENPWCWTLLGWVGTLFVGSQVMKLIMEGIRLIYDDCERPSFLGRQLRGLLLFAGTVLVW